MGPKIDAVCRFVEVTGGMAVSEPNPTGPRPALCSAGRREELQGDAVGVPEAES